MSLEIPEIEWGEEETVPCVEWIMQNLVESDRKDGAS